MANNSKRNDIGEPLDNNQTKGGYSRYTIASLLQKSCRRGDEERAAFAAFELCRSGHSWNFWDRAQVILLEDTTLSLSEVHLLPAIERLRQLATKKWDPDEGMGLACAMRAAMLLAEAESSRSILPMKNWWMEIAEDRMEALRQKKKPEHDFPVPPADQKVGEIGYIVNDTHTATGSRAGRGMPHYLVEASRVTDPSPLERKYKRKIMEHALSQDLSDEQIEHALEPVPDSDPWEHDRDLRLSHR